jgi:hypothetical protein
VDLVSGVMRLYCLRSHALRLFRLSELRVADWLPVHYPSAFTTETLESGVRRIRCTTAADPSTFFRQLAGVFTPPYFLLYVLHTPADAAPGRYQSGALSPDDLREFMAVFADFLAGDGRHDIWLSAPNDGAQVVWDRHDILYAYGRLEAVASFLRTEGYHEAAAEIPVPHAHHYHPEFDDAERRLLLYYDWLTSPLQPSDEQHPDAT